MEGLEHVGVENDPFVLVSNHSQRPETLILNSVLAFHRDGRLVHFMADWPMMLVPGVALMYRRGGVIPVFGKKPKLRVFAGMERRFRERHPGTAWDRARQLLDEGNSVGLFPESTMNRNRRRMLRGRPGAALLALEAGVPIVPAGIRFDDIDAERGREPIGDFERFSVHFGRPITPSEFPSIPAADDKALRAAGRELHQELMQRISALCGKSWHPAVARRRDRLAAAESALCAESPRFEGTRRATIRTELGD